MIRPIDLKTDWHLGYTGALGKCEAEVAMALVVRYLCATTDGHAWPEVSVWALFKWWGAQVEEEGGDQWVRAVTNNPFFGVKIANVGMPYLEKRGFVVLSEDRQQVTVTPLCIEQCAAVMPDASKQGEGA